MAGEKAGDMVIIEHRSKYNCPEIGVIVAVRPEPSVKWGRMFTIKFPDNDKLFEITYDDLRGVFEETLKQEVKIKEWKKLKKLQAEIIATMQQNG